MQHSKTGTHLETLVGAPQRFALNIGGAEVKGEVSLGPITWGTHEGTMIFTTLHIAVETQAWWVGTWPGCLLRRPTGTSVPVNHAASKFCLSDGT